MKTKYLCCGEQGWGGRVISGELYIQHHWGERSRPLFTPRLRFAVLQGPPQVATHLHILSDGAFRDTTVFVQ